MTPNATDAYNQLQAFNSSRASPADYINQANQQYGVDADNQQVSALQASLGNLQNAAAAVAPSVAGRTAGTFTTQGQRDALVNREQAPINTDINSQGQQLGVAQSAQQQAESMASQLAQGLTANDQQKYQSLLDQYNAANAAQQFQEQMDAANQQAAAAQAYQQQQLAEQVREFNNPQSTDTGLSSELSSLFGGGSSGAASSAQMQQRAGGGFNFQAAGGGTINAAQYSQAKGIPFRTLLQQMANAGDSGAATALQYVGDDYGVNTQKLRDLEVAPATYDKTVALLKSIGAQGNF